MDDKDIEKVYKNARSCIENDTFGVTAATIACLEIVYHNAKMLEEIRNIFNTPTPHIKLKTE